MILNYKVTVQYDGTNYSGWQIQLNAPSVQQTLIDSIETITKEKVNLIGSGRTDTGVHALGQVANFRTENKIDTYKFLYSLNAVLPRDISVLDVAEIHESFHSRFDAKSRTYIYLISKIKSPFYDKYSYFYPRISDYKDDLLNKISGALIGEHDFTSFSKKNSDTNNKICTVNEAKWRETKNHYMFYITANRYLHGMVRTIVGTTIFAAANNLGAEYIKEILNKKDREAAGDSAPAKGLFLFKVRY